MNSQYQHEGITEHLTNPLIVKGSNHNNHLKKKLIEMIDLTILSMVSTPILAILCFRSLGISEHR